MQEWDLRSFAFVVRYVTLVSNHYPSTFAVTDTLSGHYYKDTFVGVAHPKLKCVYSEWDETLSGAACIPLLNVAEAQLNFMTDKQATKVTEDNLVPSIEMFLAYVFLQPLHYFCCVVSQSFKTWRVIYSPFSVHAHVCAAGLDCFHAT